MSTVNHTHDGRDDNRHGYGENKQRHRQLIGQRETGENRSRVQLRTVLQTVQTQAEQGHQNGRRVRQKS